MYPAAWLMIVPTGEAQSTSKRKIPQVLESELSVHSWNNVYNELCSKTKKQVDEQHEEFDYLKKAYVERYI